MGILIIRFTIIISSQHSVRVGQKTVTLYLFGVLYFLTLIRTDLNVQLCQFSYR